MDAFQLLKADHRKVAQLFDQLEGASGKAKLRVFDQIKSELELHTQLEEKIFYPALEKPEETHDLTLEAYEEHDVVKKLLSQLSAAKTADEEWEAQAKVLRENVEHHVEEEENELFQKADDALSESDIKTLGERMEEEKARKQGRQATKTSSRSRSASSKKTASKKKSGSKRSASAAKRASSSAAAKRTSKSSASKATKRSRAKKSAKKR